MAQEHGEELGLGVSDGYTLTATGTDNYVSPEDATTDSSDESEESSSKESLTPAAKATFEQAHNNYTTYRALARGCNGQVSLGNYKGELVAIKQALHYYTANTLCKEVEALQILHTFSDQSAHFVANLIAVDVLPCPTTAIYRFYGQGNLEQFLTKNTHLGAPKRLSLMLNLSDAVKFIHDAEILHKDLKAENILIDDDGTLRISDFGSASHTNSKDIDFGGDIFTRSPKMLANTKTFGARKKNNQPCPANGLESFNKVDEIYALSLVLNHIMTGEIPFNAFKRAKLFMPYYQHVVTEKKHPDISSHQKSNAELVTLLSNCWHDDERQRPTIDAVNQTLKQLSETPQPLCS